MSARADYLAPAPSGGGWSVIAVAVAILALLGSSALAVVTINDRGGAASPEAAVSAFFAAVAAEDVLGVLDALAPGERDSLRSGVVDLADELRRLEVLSPDASLSNLQGVEYSIRDLALSTTPMGANRAVVTLSGGSFSGRVEPGRLPLGDFVRDVAGPSLSASAPASESGPLLGPGEPALNLVTLRDGGRWYFSLWYTIAEAARLDAGLPAPDAAQRVVADGASSPEEAVEALFDAGARLDVRRILELLPPDEAAVLHEYAPLFLPAAEAAATEARKSVQLTFAPLRLDSRKVGRGMLVQVREFGFRGAFPGGFGVDFRDGCVTFGAQGEQERACQRDLDSAELPAELRRLYEFGSAEFDIGFLTVKRDGEWYVSPTRSLLDALVALARPIDRSDLDGLAGAVTAILARTDEEGDANPPKRAQVPTPAPSPPRRSPQPAPSPPATASPLPPATFPPPSFPAPVPAPTSASTYIPYPSTSTTNPLGLPLP